MIYTGAKRYGLSYSGSAISQSMANSLLSPSDMLEAVDRHMYYHDMEVMDCHEFLTSMFPIGKTVTAGRIATFGTLSSNMI